MKHDVATLQNGIEFQQVVNAVNGVAIRKPFELQTPKSYGGLSPSKNVRRSVKTKNGEIYMICVRYRGRTSLEVLNDIVDGIAHLNDLDPDTDVIRSLRHAAIAATIQVFQGTELAS